MTPREALDVLEAAFVEDSVAKEAEAVADSLMTANQRALFGQFQAMPFGERLYHQRRFRQAILRNALAH